ncbi:MAG: T9SS type A sorting domain-containing protein, partial [Tangfeifania sp.]
YADAGDLEVGDGVTVVGEVDEVASVTSLHAGSVSVMTAPVDITAIPVEPMEAEAEMYESVLVMVEGARAMAEDTTTGEWIVYTEPDNDVIINDWLFAYAPTEDHYYDVTGVVNGRLDAFKVEPRMESDIVDLTATPIDPEVEVVEFNVYPNPFNDHIKIENNDKLSRVVISNIAGQRVMDIENPSNEIRTAKLVSGVYVISMFTEDGLAKTARMIKR